jgi:hypothetical protein
MQQGMHLEEKESDQTKWLAKDPPRLLRV